MEVVQTFHPLFGNQAHGDNGKVLFAQKDPWWYSIDYMRPPALIDQSYYGNRKVQPVKKSHDKILTAVGILVIGALLLDSAARV